MEFVYVIRLEGKRLYVGTTDDVKSELMKHSLGAFEYTRLHSPRKVHAVHPHDTNVRNYVAAYARFYGWENVVGGPDQLDRDGPADITRIACHYCKTTDHPSTDCDEKRTCTIL